MSSVLVTSVTCLENPSTFLAPFNFSIYYECLRPLPKDLEWKLTYVGSADSERYDQLLDSALVGPVNVGSYQFTLSAPPPDYTRIPKDDLRGVTVLLLTCSYDGQEFIRIGYYVHVDYESEAMRDEPPEQVRVDMLVRNVLAEKPRVTKFAIDWEGNAASNAAGVAGTAAAQVSGGGGGGGGDGGGDGAGAGSEHAAMMMRMKAAAASGQNEGNKENTDMVMVREKGYGVDGNGGGEMEMDDQRMMAMDG